jgi:ER-bound oxygenase mpaB/B'/Rubber oxygenase, catalytic domain
MPVIAQPHSCHKALPSITSKTLIIAITGERAAQAGFDFRTPPKKDESICTRDTSLSLHPSTRPCLRLYTSNRKEMLDGTFNQGRFACKASQSGTSDIVDLPRTETERYALLNEGTAAVMTGFGFKVAWDPATHLAPASLDHLRLIGDDVGDAAANIIKQHLLKSKELSQPAVQGIDLLRELQPSSKEARAFIGVASAIPPWVDWQRIALGQQFFARNIGPIGLALLNLSLIGGFGAPKINKVLDGTGYLSRGNGTARRLSETLQMLLDCCVDAGSPGHDNALRPWNKGWKSTLNVRLLHSGVRTWLMKTHNSSIYDVKSAGVPINQEDLLVTMAAFSSVVCIGLERCHLLDNESDEAISDYFHLWRYIGFLIGIDSDSTALYPPEVKALYDRCDTLKGGQALLESIAAHLVIPDPSSRRIAMHVIESCSYRPPIPRTPYLHVLLTRMLAGEDYADSLGIPRLEDDELLDLDHRAKEKGEKEAKAKEEKEKLEKEKLRMATKRKWLGWMLSWVPSPTPILPQRHPLYLPPEEGEPTEVGVPRNSSNNSNFPSPLAIFYSSMKFAGWVTVVLPLALSFRLVMTAKTAACKAWDLLLLPLAFLRKPKGPHQQLSREEEKAKKIREAKATALVVFSRYRFISTLTHLPLVGGLIARLLASTLVSLIEAQLGGRTEFPIRRKYI